MSTLRLPPVLTPWVTLDLTEKESRKTTSCEILPELRSVCTPPTTGRFTHFSVKVRGTIKSCKLIPNIRSKEPRQNRVHRNCLGISCHRFRCRCRSSWGWCCSRRCSCLPIPVASLLVTIEDLDTSLHAPTQTQKSAALRQKADQRYHSTTKLALHQQSQCLSTK